MKRTILITLLLSVCTIFISTSSSASSNQKNKPITVSKADDNHSIENIHESQVKELGKHLKIWCIIPFIGILLSIAFLPRFAPHFWHYHFGAVSVFWTLVFSIPFLIVFPKEASHEILYVILQDFAPFIILIGALYTISGGVIIKGTPESTPLLNTLFLFIGTIVASWIGTTGAAMIMIRPVLTANKQRKNKTHIIVFFIFLVCNIGGALSPLGDPPLFLGYLHGVPFFWTLKLIKPMAVALVILLSLFFIIDLWFFKKDKIKCVNNDPKKPFRIKGFRNLTLIIAILVTIIITSQTHLGHFSILGVQLAIQNVIRDLLIISFTAISWIITSKKIRHDNHFTWFPIIEVSYLFAGIFITIIPVIAMLKAGHTGPLGFILNHVTKPWEYFWVTGGLSSFLDNAPTYLTFFNTALGQFFRGVPEQNAVKLLIMQKEIFLLAISCGAVFMGALTYIGNAPNLMIQAIAEEADVKTPSFFHFMLWSFSILIPIFLLITFLFF